jgi:hypothetical protein
MEPTSAQLATPISSWTGMRAWQMIITAKMRIMLAAGEVPALARVGRCTRWATTMIIAGAWHAKVEHLALATSKTGYGRISQLLVLTTITAKMRITLAAGEVPALARAARCTSWATTGIIAGAWHAKVEQLALATSKTGNGRITKLLVPPTGIARMIPTLAPGEVPALARTGRCTG